MRLFILSLFLVCSQLWAEPKIEVLYQGDVAPFDGLLINSAQEREFRRINEELLLYKDLSELHEEQRRIYDERIANLNSNSSMWNNILFFSLGAALTGVIAFGTVKAIK